jgi:hypothetical protein
MTDLHGADTRLMVENVAPQQTVRPHGKKVFFFTVISCQIPWEIKGQR